MKPRSLFAGQEEWRGVHMKPGNILSRTAKTVLWGTALVIAAAIRLLSAGFAPSSAAAQTSEVSRGKAGTYYLLVFSNPVAGMEDEYNRWYSRQHQQDVVSVPGFVTAQRFVVSGVQLRDSKPLPKYLVMYKIVTSDLPSVYAEVNRRIQTGVTAMSPAYDRATSVTYTFRAFRPMIYHKGDQPATPKDAPVYYQIVFSNPTEGMEDQYNQWYDEQHAPDVVSTPGFVEAQRFILSDTQLSNKEPLTKYLVMFRIVSDDVAARFADFRRLAPSMPTSPAMGKSYGYTYKAMEPMIEGDQVRAERAKKKFSAAN
jgi:hypothetical protein